MKICFVCIYIDENMYSVYLAAEILMQKTKGRATKRTAQNMSVMQIYLFFMRNFVFAR